MEAFEVICNKTPPGSSIAERLASFFENILKKGGSEKLSDEAIEETLEKVVLLVLCCIKVNYILLAVALVIIYVIVLYR
jgi:hypothetical protein